jgi:hypothetical protein
LHYQLLYEANVERKELESAAVRIRYGRGLIVVPAGVLFIVTGLGNLRWGVFANDWVFILSVACVAAAVLLARRYYDTQFGKVAFPHGRQLRFDVTAAALSAVALVGGVILDSFLDLPVSLFAITFALSALAWLAATVGVRLHHLVVGGALLLGGALPVWGDLDDRVSVAWLPIGCATIVVGLLDHLQLVRDYGAAPHSDLPGSHVEA